MPRLESAWWSKSNPASRPYVPEEKPEFVTLPWRVVIALRTTQQQNKLELAKLHRRKLLQKQRASKVLPSAIEQAQQALDGALKASEAAAADCTEAHREASFLRQVVVRDLVDELTALQAREAWIEEVLLQKSIQTAKEERGAVLHFSVLIEGKVPPLRPFREAATACLHLSGSNSSACVTKNGRRVGLHIHLPSRLRRTPALFSEFKRHFNTVRKGGELRDKLQHLNSPIVSAQPFRVLAVTMPQLLDGAAPTVPEGADKLGFNLVQDPTGLDVVQVVQPFSWAEKARLTSDDRVIWMGMPSENKGLLLVRIVAASGLAASVAAYVVLRINKKEHRTEIASSSTDPKWSSANFDFRIDTWKRKDQWLQLELYCSESQGVTRSSLSAVNFGGCATDVMSAYEKSLGSLWVYTPDLEPGVTTQWVDKLKGGCGQLEAHIRFLPDMKDEPLAEIDGQILSDLMQTRPLHMYVVHAPSEATKRVRTAMVEADLKWAVRDMDIPHLRAALADAEELATLSSTDLEVARMHLQEALDTQYEPAHTRLRMALKGLVFPEIRAAIMHAEDVGLPPSEIQSARDVLSEAAAGILHRLRKATQSQDLSRLRAAVALAQAAGCTPGELNDTVELVKLLQAEETDARQIQTRIAKLMRKAAKRGSLNVGEPEYDGQVWTITVGEDVEASIDALGFTLSDLDAEQVFVDQIDQDLLAVEEPLSQGDELVAVEGLKIANLSAEELRDILLKRPLQLTLRLMQADLRTMIVTEDVHDLGFRPAGIPPDIVTIASIQHSGWARGHHLAKGDNLVAINGLDVSSMTGSDYRQLMLRRPLYLTFQRKHGWENQNGAHDGDEEENYYIRTFDATAEVEKLGFEPSAMPPERVFIKVQAGTWAQSQGLAEGDELVTIESQEVSQIRGKDLNKVLRRRPLRLKFRRKGGWDIQSADERLFPDEGALEDFDGRKTLEDITVNESYVDRASASTGSKKDEEDDGPQGADESLVPQEGDSEGSDGREKWEDNMINESFAERASASTGLNKDEEDKDATAFEVSGGFKVLIRGQKPANAWPPESEEVEKQESIELFFDVSYYEIYQDDFKAGVKDGLSDLGCSDENLEKVTVDLRPGSTVAKISGPTSALRAVKACPLDSLSVMGYKAFTSSDKLVAYQAEKVKATYWRYTPQNGWPISPRIEPDINAEQLDADIEPGSVLKVSTEQEGADGVLYLQLAEGGGWLFDKKPGAGTMCTRVPLQEIWHLVDDGESADLEDLDSFMQPSAVVPEEQRRWKRGYTMLGVQARDRAQLDVEKFWAGSILTCLYADPGPAQIFESFESEVIIGAVGHGDIVEVAGEPREVKECMMVPIKPTGVVQLDLFEISKSSGQSTQPSAKQSSDGVMGFSAGTTWNTRITKAEAKWDAQAGSKWSVGEWNENIATSNTGVEWAEHAGTPGNVRTANYLEEWNENSATQKTGAEWAAHADAQGIVGTSNYPEEWDENIVTPNAGAVWDAHAGTQGNAEAANYSEGWAGNDPTLNTGADWDADASLQGNLGSANYSEQWNQNNIGAHWDAHAGTQGNVGTASYSEEWDENIATPNAGADWDAHAGAQGKMATASYSREWDENTGWDAQAGTQHVGTANYSGPWDEHAVTPNSGWSAQDDTNKGKKNRQWCRRLR